MDLFHSFGVPGRWFTEFFEIAATRYGFVTSEDAGRIGAPAGALVDMQRHGQLDRVGHGVYRFRAVPSGPLDELMQATLWPRGLGVISHESALDLWDLCDVNPAKIHVTVPKAARIRRAVPHLYEVHVRDLVAADHTHHDGIPVVTPMRAILDGVERHLDARLLDQAIAGGRARGLLLRDEIEALEEARR